MLQCALSTLILTKCIMASAQGILSTLPSNSIISLDGRSPEDTLGRHHNSQTGTHVFGEQAMFPTPTPTSSDRRSFVPVSVLQMHTHVKFCSLQCGIFRNDENVIVSSNGRFRSVGERAVAYGIAANVPYTRAGDNLQSATFVAVSSSNETSLSNSHINVNDIAPPSESPVAANGSENRTTSPRGNNVSTGTIRPFTSSRIPTSSPSTIPDPVQAPGAKCDTIIHIVIEISLQRAGIFNDPLGRPLSMKTPSVMALAVDTTRTLEQGVTSGAIEQNLAEINFIAAHGICKEPFDWSYQVGSAKVPAVPSKPMEIDRCTSQFVRGGWNSLDNKCRKEYTGILIAIAVTIWLICICCHKVSHAGLKDPSKLAFTSQEEGNEDVNEIKSEQYRRFGYLDPSAHQSSSPIRESKRMRWNQNNAESNLNAEHARKKILSERKVRVKEQKRLQEERQERQQKAREARAQEQQRRQELRRLRDSEMLAGQPNYLTLLKKKLGPKGKDMEHRTTATQNKADILSHGEKEQAEYEAKLRYLRASKGLSVEDNLRHSYVVPSMHEKKYITAAAIADGVARGSSSQSRIAERKRHTYEDKLHKARVARGLSSERHSMPGWLKQNISPPGRNKKKATQSVSLIEPKESEGCFSADGMAFGLWALDLEKGNGDSSQDDDDEDTGRIRDFTGLSNYQTQLNFSDYQDPPMSEPGTQLKRSDSQEPLVSVPRNSRQEELIPEDNKELQADLESISNDETGRQKESAEDAEDDTESDEFDNEQFHYLFDRSDDESIINPFGKVLDDDTKGSIDFGGMYVPGWQLGDGFSGGHE